MFRLIRNFLAKWPTAKISRPLSAARPVPSVAQEDEYTQDTTESPPSREVFSPRKSSSPPQLLINCLRNNIFFCLSKAPGETIFALSAGRAGFPGAQKTSPKAALAMLDILAKKLGEMGVDRLRLNFRGLNPARPILIGQLRRMGLRITEVVDTTGVPHNGCRPPKARRL